MNPDECIKSNDVKWQQTIDYLYSQRPSYERQGNTGYKPGLHTSHALDRMFGEPHRHYATIHVAGSNGKGSVAHLLAAMLQLSGYKVGLYTSPHFVDFRERIRVNGKMVEKQYVIDWVDAFRRAPADIQSMNPSFFELTSTMAFCYFATRQVDVAVIEVGLGGRLDSTNIITPRLSVITNISLEHTQFLGDTLAEIATEKAGIIKPRVPVVVGEAEGDVKEVFRHRAQAVDAPITFVQDVCPPIVETFSTVSGELSLETRTYGTLNSQLSGDYQVKNAATVLAAVEQLNSSGFEIKEDAVKEAFAHVCELTGLMGRWMKLGETPLVICDSGHNVAGITAIVDQLRRMRYRALHLVLGFMADKDLGHILPLLPVHATYYFTQASTPRALTAEQLRRQAEPFGLSGKVFSSVSEAYTTALGEAEPDDLVYVGGSMYVLAELFSFLQTQE